MMKAGLSAPIHQLSTNEAIAPVAARTRAWPTRHGRALLSILAQIDKATGRMTAGEALEWLDSLSTAIQRRIDRWGWKIQNKRP
jgi:hypothetical protein